MNNLWGEATPWQQIIIAPKLTHKPSIRIRYLRKLENFFSIAPKNTQKTMVNKANDIFIILEL